MIAREPALRLIFEDLHGRLDEPADGAVPLVSLVDEMSAGFPPAQELFDELASSLCCGVLEFCDDAQYIRIRDVQNGAAREPRTRSDSSLKLGELAMLAAGFAQLGLMRAEQALAESRSAAPPARFRATRF